ncbi:MAG TPA: DUF6263 family protein [Isosphaeraceae bacterium]|nr:DUF6263 family protein [Isosphaeraceae bacterium]
MRALLPAFSATLLSCALAIAADEAPVKLVLKYPEGSKFTRQQTVRLHQVLTLAGMDIETDAEEIVTSTRSIGTRKPDGSVPMEVEVTALKANMSLPGGISIQFDSAGPPEDIDPQLKFIVDMLRAFSGSHYTVVIGPRGDIQSIEGAQAIIDRASDLDPKAGDALRSRLSPEALKRAWHQDADRIPEILVRPGEPWTRSEHMEIGSGQSFTFERTYEYLGTIEKNGTTLDKIGVKATGVTYASAADPNSPVKVDKSDLKVKSSEGALLFDREAGRVVESTETTRITGSLTLIVTANDMALDADLDLTLENTSMPKVD